MCASAIEWKKIPPFLYSCYRENIQWLVPCQTEMAGINSSNHCNPFGCVCIPRHARKVSADNFPWLRIITKIPPPNSSDIPTKVPYAKFFESQLINLDNRYNKLLPNGVWSTSVMGCADKGYARDFQHLVLQSLVPKVGAITFS